MLRGHLEISLFTKEKQMEDSWTIAEFEGHNYYYFIIIYNLVHYFISHSFCYISYSISIIVCFHANQGHF